MKPTNKLKKLYRRRDDHAKGPRGNDRSKSLVWGDRSTPYVGFHKPGSNKK